MAKKEPLKNTPGKVRQRSLRTVWKAGITLVVAGSLLVGLAFLKVYLLEELKPRSRYQVQFTDIVCAPPHGLDRATFLTEVQYVSAFPSEFSAIDPELPGRLQAAFQSHPLVAKIDEVAVEPGGRIEVRIKYRTPLLAVAIRSGGMRAVDESGMLLPLAAVTAGLPLLASPLAEPSVAAGQLWKDDTLTRAVELVMIHHPKSLEWSTDGWRLTMSDGRVLAIKR